MQTITEEACTEVHIYSNGSKGCTFFCDAIKKDKEESKSRHGLRISTDKDGKSCTFEVSLYQFWNNYPAELHNHTYIPHTMITFSKDMAKNICHALIEMGFGK